MKVLGYVMLHYGKDYLEAVLNPLCQVCNKVIILYSYNPTHNAIRDVRRLEARNELQKITMKFNNVQWIDVTARNEAEHRGLIWQYCGGYDVLVNADSDEVWELESLKRAIDEVYNSPYRVHGINGFIHFWRSFNDTVARCEWHEDEPDFFRPERLWHLREKNTSQTPVIDATIYHFGYAVRREVMEYKMQIHGHRSEWREDFFDLWDQWQPDNRRGQFHPTSYQIWHEIRSFDRKQLPVHLHNHPFYKLKKI